MLQQCSQKVKPGTVPTQSPFCTQRRANSKRTLSF